MLGFDELVVDLAGDGFEEGVLAGDGFDGEETAAVVVEDAEETLPRNRECDPSSMATLCPFINRKSSACLRSP